MLVSKLLRHLLAPMHAGIVDADGGGAAVLEDERQNDEASDGEGEQATGEQAGDEQQAGDGEGQAEADAEELVVTIGDEPAPEDGDDGPPPGLSPKANAAWFQHRRQKKELKDELRKARMELEQLRAGQAQAAPAAAAVGEKPTLESCDYDPERFAAEFQEWHARKVSADEQARQREREETKAREQWAGRMESVSAAAKSLKVPDYDDAAAEVDDLFSPVQQGILIGGPDDPKSSALMRYALGKNPKKARELAAITDPVKFTFALAKLETQLKVTPRKSAPPPEQVVRSNVSGARVFGAAKLAELQAEAHRTGDFSKYLEAKRAAKG